MMRSRKPKFGCTTFSFTLLFLALAIIPSTQHSA